MRSCRLEIETVDTDIAIEVCVLHFLSVFMQCRSDFVRIDQPAPIARLRWIGNLDLRRQLIVSRNCLLVRLFPGSSRRLIPLGLGGSSRLIRFVLDLSR